MYSKFDPTAEDAAAIGRLHPEQSKVRAEHPQTAGQEATKAVKQARQTENASRRFRSLKDADKAIFELIQALTAYTDPSKLSQLHYDYLLSSFAEKMGGDVDGNTVNITQRTMF